MKKPLITAICLIFSSFTVQAAEPLEPTTSSAVEQSSPDNTDINKRDRNEQTLTPLDQSEGWPGFM